MNQSSELHTQRQHLGVPEPTSQQTASIMNQLRKTKLCTFNSNGWCKDGSECNFAHGEEELRNPPVFHKSQLCTYFAHGDCKNDRACRFAHGVEDLRGRRAHRRRSGLQTQALAPCTQHPQLHDGHGSLVQSATVVHCNDGNARIPGMNMLQVMPTSAVYADRAPEPMSTSVELPVALAKFMSHGVQSYDLPLNDTVVSEQRAARMRKELEDLTDVLSEIVHGRDATRLVMSF